MKKLHKKMEKLHFTNRDDEFAKRFRTLLGNRNLKLRDIAEATGCAISTVSTWKNGRRPKREATLIKLCGAFDVSPSYLLKGEKERSEYIFSNDADDRIFRAASPEKSDIEEYVRQLIEAAEKREGGLAHLRFELRRKLPLRLYS